MSRKFKIVSIFIFTVIGFLMYKLFMKISISFLELENSPLVSLSTDEPFYSHIKFSLIIGLIPILLMIRDRVLHQDATSLKKDIIALIVILISGSILLQFRIFWINRSVDNLESDVMKSFLFSNLNFNLWLIIGFVIGTIISIFLTKNKGD